MTGHPLTLKVNGQERALSVSATRTLLETLREDLALTGAKRGCNQGVCGACTVLVDGQPVRGCLSLTANCDGAEVTTVEGLADGNVLSTVQQAMADTGAVQCGFCTSGMLISAFAFLRDNSAPTVDDIQHALSGNLCRCSGYRKIVDSILLAAKRVA
ncbi:MAG TPA: (2Fe-2S)-binding protein [Alphaproteobacteria bacterium]|nr:(2Fe-2S)-binding protein [Alphaproteobacteria bacterium]